MKFNSHHFCIKVADLQRSMKFYQEALGFEEPTIIRHMPGVTSCFLQAGDRKLQIQLLEGVGPAECGAGYGHLGMHTDDIRKSFEFHEGLGCVSDKIVEQPYQFGYFIQDPDGYKTEIVQLKN